MTEILFKVTQNAKFTRQSFSLQFAVHSNHRILVNSALEIYGSNEHFTITYEKSRRNVSMTTVQKLTRSTGLALKKIGPNAWK